MQATVWRDNKFVQMMNIPKTYLNEILHPNIDPMRYSNEILVMRYHNLIYKVVMTYTNWIPVMIYFDDIL